MAIGDLRLTVLQTVNEVQRKLGLSATSLSANKVSVELIDHINDVCSDLSDFGNWMETLTTANVTAQVSIRDYNLVVSGVVKNIGDIYISTRRGPLRSVDIDTMRIMTRSTTRGTPTQYCIFGTDTNGQPIIRVRPIPDSSNDGALFSVLYYLKPSLYTTADSDSVIPFPSRVVVLGVLASYTLRESGGSPTPLYEMYINQYIEQRRQSLNRFNSDTGWDISFTPGRASRWRK